MGGEIKKRHPVIYDLSYRLINSVESYYIGDIPESYNSYKEAAQLAKEYLWIDDPSITIYRDENYERMTEENMTTDYIK